MNYVGKWIFHSILSSSESDDLVYLSATEFLNEPMPYIDETDTEEVANELRQRKIMTEMQLEICEDGKMYMLMPIPEGISQEEVDAAVEAGEIKLRNGMASDDPTDWEERDGEFWYDTRIEGEALGEKTGTWAKASDNEGFIHIFTTRFIKQA